MNWWDREELQGEGRVQRILKELEIHHKKEVKIWMRRKESEMLGG